MYKPFRPYRAAASPWLVGLFVGLFVSLGCSSSKTGEAEPKESTEAAAPKKAEHMRGRQAPDFELKTADGQSVILSKVAADRPVVLISGSFT